MTSDVYVHVRREDGAMGLVGRYRLVMPAAGSYPTTGNCLTGVENFDLSRDEVQDIVATLAIRMRSWRDDFAADGVDDATVRRLARAFSKDLD